MELTHIILFHDHSRRLITEADSQIYFQGRRQGKTAMIIDGGSYAFSSMAKVLSVQEFYEQYPAERPQKTAENKFPTLDEMINVAPNRIRALKGIIAGLKNYISGPEYQGTKKPIELLKVMEERLFEAQKTI